MSISTIMAGIATLTPTYNGETVNIWTYDSMHDTLNESECPVRMIGLLSPDNNVGFDVRNLNNKDEAEWQIIDSLFAFPTPLDMGIENHNHALWDYMEDYMQAVSSDACLGSGGAFRVERVDFTEDVRRYPDGDGSPVFWVVDALLTIVEYR